MTRREGTPPDKVTLEERTQLIYEAQLIFISRYLAVPRLLLGGPDDLMRVELNFARGEVGPLFFHPEEVDEIYNFIQRRLVPSPDTAPFPAPEAVPAGAGAAGSAERGDGKAPSQYLGLTGSDPTSLYWQWCIDSAVSRCLEHERDKQRDREEQARKEHEEGYEAVVPE